MPHLRSLVKRYEEAPFELIGVNTGDPVDEYKAGIEKHGVSWLSAYQGDSTPIADMYSVRGYPTYLVIDVDGTIVWRSRDSKNKHRSMDDAIEALVKKAQEKGSK